MRPERAYLKAFLVGEKLFVVALYRGFVGKPSLVYCFKAVSMHFVGIYSKIVQGFCRDFLLFALV